MTGEREAEVVREPTEVRHRYTLRGGTVVRHIHRCGRDEQAQERRLRLIRGLLVSLDITQRQVASEAGLSPDRVNRMLAGSVPASPRLASALARLIEYRDSSWWARLLGVPVR